MQTETAENEVAAPNPQALAVLPPQERAMVALKSEAAERELRALVERTSAIKNVVDKNGREEAHRAYMTLKNARVAITNAGKVAREDATAFQRAVVAEVDRLTEITGDEEERLYALREAYDTEQRRIELERERLAKERADAIAASMSAIRNLPGGLVGSSAAEISEVARALALKEITEQEFGDQLGAATDLINAVGQQLHTMLGAAVARELAEAQRQQELVRLRAEADELKRKADEAEVQRLREETERREELERSTRAQAEAMAAQKRQQEHMAEIKRVQSLGMTIGDARMVDEALALARAFDPATFGEMEPMAKMARDLAVSSLEMRLARVLELELPGAMDEAIRINSDMIQAAHAALTAHLVPVAEIDWDEPAPAAAPAPATEPAQAAPAWVDDSPAVIALREAIADLRKTRTDAEIRTLFNDEMAVMAAKG